MADPMDLRELIASLPAKSGSIHTLEKGKDVRRPYSVLHADVVAAREALLSWGVKGGVRVGIFAPNSYRWLVYDLALIDIGAISVAFTEDFAGGVDEALLERHDIALLLVSSAASNAFSERRPHIALIDGENSNVKALDRVPALEADSADQLGLVFSSGSAGGLKGLVISRAGVFSILVPVINAIGAIKGDRLLLFLPMSNFQQRFGCYAAILNDSVILLTDYTRLFDAMRILSPTILLAPPVFYQMVYSEFASLPAWKRNMLSVFGDILSRLPSSRMRRAIAQRAYKPLYRQFGGKIRIMITGMAPIAPAVTQFFSRLQLPLSESYGMVEAGLMAFRPAGSRMYGSVGKPLEDVNFTFDEGGQITAHRPHPVALRYFECAPGENERTFTGPGQIATGDIGRIDGQGWLYLLGRGKELIITPGGYKLHPEIVEQELNGCPDIAASVVFLARNAVLSAVLVLHHPRDTEARERVQRFAAGIRSSKKAAPFVQIIFAEEAFTRENGLLRPNMKIDRKAIVGKYDSLSAASA